MLASLVLSAAAGWAVLRAEPVLARMLAAALKVEAPLGPRDLRVLTLLVLLGLAALVTAALGADSSAFAAVLGAGLGYFGPALYRLLANRHDVPEEARWDGRLRAPGTGRAVQRPHAGAAPDAEDAEDAETLRAVADALETDALETDAQQDVVRGAASRPDSPDDDHKEPRP